MSTKRCAYRGCDSYSNPSHPCSETFYAFPKDPERCKRWLKLGGCRDQIPFTSRYFCSKHFDETKYVAHNQRRKQLLSTAIPWAYNQSPQREIFSDDVDYQCVESTIEDNDDDEAHLERYQDSAVSVEVANDISNITETIEDALQSYEYHEETCPSGFTIALATEPKQLKRKYGSITKESPAPEELQTGTSNHNIISNRATSSTLLAANEEHAKDLKLIEEFDENMLLEASNLTTFIFKGQEYIQMPKDEYITEKMALIQKIKAYEDILKNVKQLMNSVNI